MRILFAAFILLLAACGGNGKSACATAAAQFEANPNDSTAQVVRDACHME